MKKKVAIVGAGLSGLACGLELKRAGAEVSIFDTQSEVGGRVRTDAVDGFLLDHGFQVFLPSYELGPHFLNYEKLEMKAFAPGAEIYKQGAFYKISDPLRDPKGLLPTLISPLASFKDKLLILKFILGKGIDYKDVGAGDTALNYLKSFGFSQKFIQGFFMPFFSGVFLNRDLSVSEDFFRYLFQKFSEGYASLPAVGMKGLPEQMALEIGPSSIYLNHKVDLSTFTKTDFDHCVWANGSPVSGEAPRAYNTVTTHYYKTQSTAWAGKTLYLNGGSEGPVNHVACLTAVQPSYAPEGWHLFSVNSLIESTAGLEDHLCEIFGKVEIDQWEHLKSYSIKKALPKKTEFGRQNPRNEDGIFLCGDHMETASIQGALQSGLRVAQEIMKTAR